MYHIIYNPVAGKKTALKNLQTVIRIFKERGVKFLTHESHATRECEKIARELTE
jgi:diacylglycerol kinase family enzyme